MHTLLPTHTQASSPGPCPPTTNEQPAAQKKKLTIAQWRAEKGRREEDVQLGCQLAFEVGQGLVDWELMPVHAEVRYDQLHEMLDKASRACELLKNELDSDAYLATNHEHLETFGYSIYVGLLTSKGALYLNLGQQTLALAVYQQVHDIFKAAEREGQFKEGDQFRMIEVVGNIGAIYLCLRRLEPAMRCFLKVLALPDLEAYRRVEALHLMAHYYKERKAWTELTECCEKVLMLLPELQ